jgi:hypothetical protein
MSTSLTPMRSSSTVVSDDPILPGEYLAFRLGAEQYGIDILRVGCS